MIIVDNIQLQNNDQVIELRGDVQIKNEKRTMWFRWQGKECHVPADTFLIATLLFAMRANEKLIIKGVVSERLLLNIYKIQEIHHCFDRELSIIEVEVEHVLPWNMTDYWQRIQTESTMPNASTVGCCFSGGVDSFYSIFQHIHEIETLVFVHGFDIKLEDTVLKDKVLQSLQQAANRLEKELLFVETNIHYFCHYAGDWGMHYNGAAIAAVGAALSNHLHKLYIPSSVAYDSLFACGSHPLLDPLYSTNYIDFDHDGCEATRIEKVKAITVEAVAMDTLRVCYENPNSTYNCGRCRKCISTMFNLELFGALVQCKTFDRPFNINELQSVRSNPIEQVRIKEILSVANKLNLSADIIKFLQQLLTNNDVKLTKPILPQRIDIHDYLKQFSGKRVNYIPNQGNAGDALIAAATYQLFEKHHIKYVTRFSDAEIEAIEGGIVFYGGGGNLVLHYYKCEQRVTKALPRCDQLVILPHTIQGHYRFLHHLPKKVTILCRDLNSYHYVKNIYSAPEQVYLCDDLAFHFDYQPYQNQGEGIANMFRLDVEKTDITIPADNVDLSSAIKIPLIDSIETHHKFLADVFVKYIAQYQVVNTNRLHIGIAAANLGKKVTLHANSYWKNEAVFQLSMQNHYPNVTFIPTSTKPITNTDDTLVAKFTEMINVNTVNQLGNDLEGIRKIITLGVAAWNYAISSNYQALKHIVEQDDINTSRQFEYILTILIERKLQLFPTDHHLIKHCEINVIGDNSYQLLLNKT